MRRSQRSSPLRCRFPASRTMSSRPLGMSGLASAVRADQKPRRLQGLASATAETR